MRLVVVAFPYFENWDNYEFPEEHNQFKKIIKKNNISHLDLCPYFKNKNSKGYIISNKN